MNKFLKTEKYHKGNAAGNAVLSFFFTGMGQILNGRLSRGTTLFLLRSVFLLVVPFSAVIKVETRLLYIFALFLSLAAAITLVAPLESAVYRRGNKKIPLKKYNTMFFYVICGAINLAVTSILIFTVFAFFSIKKTDNDTGVPLIEKDDTILISMYHKDSFSKGELVIYDKTIGRVTALHGDTVEIGDGIIFINGLQLSHGVCDKEITGLFPEYSDSILSETHNNKSYPVISKIALSRNKRLKKIFIKKNEIFCVRDNRKREKFHDVIKKSEVNGRIEGILFSGRPGKILLPPFFKK